MEGSIFITYNVVVNIPLLQRLSLENTVKMVEFYVKYKAKYRLKYNTNYVFSTCGLCYNMKTNRVIRQIKKNYTNGYLIDRKFRSLVRLREELEEIPIKEDLPF